MKTVLLPTLECLRCGHRWIPRKFSYAHKALLPHTCPSCRSSYWDAPFGSNSRQESINVMQQAHGGLSVYKKRKSHA